MISKRKIEDETLAKALLLIDSDGTLLPETRQYDRISVMIRGWIDQCGTEYTLCMAQIGAKHLDSWRKFL